MEDVLGMGNKKEGEREQLGPRIPLLTPLSKTQADLQAPPPPDKPDCFTGTITISDVQELEVWLYLQPDLGESRLPEKNHFNQENIISD